MSRPKVHVLIPHSTKAACGVVSPYNNAATRDRVTCKKCKETDHYKALPIGRKSH